MINYISITRDRVPQRDGCNNCLEPLDLQNYIHTILHHCKSEYFIDHTTFYKPQSHQHHTIYRYKKHHTRIHTYNTLTLLWESKEPRRIWHIPWRHSHIYIDRKKKFWNNGNIIFKMSCTDTPQRSVNTKVLSLLGLNKAL